MYTRPLSTLAFVTVAIHGLSGDAAPPRVAEPHGRRVDPRGGAAEGSDPGRLR